MIYPLRVHVPGATALLMGPPAKTLPPPSSSSPLSSEGSSNNDNTHPDIRLRVEYSELRDSDVHDPSPHYGVFSGLYDGLSVLPERYSRHPLLPFLTFVCVCFAMGMAMSALAAARGHSKTAGEIFRRFTSGWLIAVSLGPAFAMRSALAVRLTLACILVVSWREFYGVLARMRALLQHDMDVIDGEVTEEGVKQEREEEEEDEDEDTDEDDSKMPPENERKGEEGSIQTGGTPCSSSSNLFLSLETWSAQLIFFGTPALWVSLPSLFPTFDDNAVVEVVFVVLISDCMQYSGGRVFGLSTCGIPLLEHRPFPALSKKKSLGGYLFTLLCTPALTYLLFAMTPLASTVLVLLGIGGDLLASHYKRRAKVKDFSSLLRSHGGFMDRFDGVILGLSTLLWLDLLLGVEAVDWSRDIA